MSVPTPSNPSATPPLPNNFNSVWSDSKRRPPPPPPVGNSLSRGNSSNAIIANSSPLPPPLPTSHTVNGVIFHTLPSASTTARPPHPPTHHNTYSSGDFPRPRNASVTASPAASDDSAINSNVSSNASTPAAMPQRRSIGSAGERDRPPPLPNKDDGGAIDYYLRQAITAHDIAKVRELLTRAKSLKLNGETISTAESILKDFDADSVGNEIATLKPYLRQAIDTKNREMLRVALEKAEKIVSALSSTNKRLYSDFLTLVDEARKSSEGAEKQDLEILQSFLKQGIAMKSREILKETLDKINKNALNPSFDKELLNQASTLLAELDSQHLIKFYLKRAMEQKDENALEDAIEQAIKLKVKDEELKEAHKFLAELKAKAAKSSSSSTKSWFANAISRSTPSSPIPASPITATATSSSSSNVNGTASKLFGAALTDILQRPAAHLAGIPKILTHCVDYLREHALNEPGLFRVAGNKDQIEALRQQYDDDTDNKKVIPLTDVHDTAGLLKLYIRSLPEPLLAYDSYDKFLRCGAIKDDSKRVELLKEAVAGLPDRNLSILRYLMEFLHDVSSNKEVNKMSPDNLAIVFTPNLLKPRIETPQTLINDTPASIACVTALIINYDDIFPAQAEAEEKIKHEEDRLKREGDAQAQPSPIPSLRIVPDHEPSESSI